MLELRLSIISINPAPNKSRSERGRFMGWLVVRSFAHHATMVTLVTGPDDQYSRRRVRQPAIWRVFVDRSRKLAWREALPVTAPFAVQAVSKRLSRSPVSSPAG